MRRDSVDSLSASFRYSSSKKPANAGADHLLIAIDHSDGGTPATIVSDAASQIVTAVPSSATTGRISVTTAAGTATSVATFIVN